MTSKFKDFRNNLDIHPVNGDIILLEDDKAIANQIKNLIFTGTYETFWNPKVGASIPQTLFENFGYDSKYLIETKVKECLASFVKRAKIILVNVKDSSLTNQYSLTIVFQPLNKIDNVTLNIILKRVR